MYCKVFNCTVVTPMFLYGAIEDVPELRPPSIKGMMRYWWRAINGNLDVDILRKIEGEIFGGTEKGQSTFSITTEPCMVKVAKYQPLPHHTNNNTCPYLPSCKHKRLDKCSKGFKRSAFSPGGKFKVTLLANNAKLPEWIGDLFEISCLLGGFGNRSRRGFGCIEIEGVVPDLRIICDKLNRICEANDFTISNANCLVRSSFPQSTSRPSIKLVELSSKCYETTQEMLKIIGSASHEYNPSGSDALGRVKRGRLASPVYVSILKIDGNYRPIVTTLNIVPDEDDSQNKFREAICK